MTFDELNHAVACRMQDSAVDKPDDLTLAESTAWEGLMYLYTLYRMGRYDREMCLALKEQLRHEYETCVSRFERIDREFSDGIAALRLCRTYPDKTGKQILAQIEGERNGR